jgi:hypothetical protein
MPTAFSYGAGSRHWNLLSPQDWSGFTDYLICRPLATEEARIREEDSNTFAWMIPQYFLFSVRGKGLEEPFRYTSLRRSGSGGIGGRFMGHDIRTRTGQQPIDDAHHLPRAVALVSTTTNTLRFLRWWTLGHGA